VSPQRRQKTILALLLALLAVVVLRQLAGSEGGGGGRGAARARRGADATEAIEVPELHLARLTAERAVYAPGRDPFRYGPRPAPPPSEPTAAQAKAAARRAAGAGGGADGEARGRRGQARPPQPQAPEIEVQYLGSFGPPGDRIAVFLDGEEIINAKVGDVLKNQFIVQGIGFESVDLGFVGFPAEPNQRLPAGG
jgi:hypothetical protein